jgi:vitamin B12 transporter
LADLLARVPGLEFSRNGGVGNATSVFLRGSESRHTAVLVDGVRLDAQNTSGGANWSTIPLSQIDYIEIVRGPTSTVYGSDAVAGVIQIFTKQGDAGFSPSISMGVGTYNTQKVDFSALGGEGAVDYSIGLSAGQSSGFNIRAIATQNPDTDGYLSNSANLRLGLKPNSDHRVEILAMQSRVDAQYDSNFAKDDRVVSTDSTQSLGWNAKWTDRYATKVSVGQSVDQSQYSPLASSNKTKIDNALFFNEYQWGKQSVSATLEQRNDAFQVSDGQRIDRAKSQTGVGFGYAWTGDVNTVQLSARNDNDSEFGTKTTTSAAYAFAFTPQLRALASSATSFRVPTLYQRFHADYGVATLLPESGRNVELGLKYSQGSRQWGVAVYRNTVANLLGFIQTTNPLKVTCPKPTKGCYANTAEAQYQGITFSAQQAMGGVNTWASLDLQEPRDVGTGKVSRDWSVLVRLDNATDTAYQLIDTYATAGRTLYVGLKWAP